MKKYIFLDIDGVLATPELVVDGSTKVIVICPKHGEYFVTPTGHITSSYRCKKCSVPKNIKHPGGYSGKYKHEPDYELFMYKVRLYNKEESFYKVGLSNNPEVRFRAFPYEVEVLSMIHGTLGKLFPMEQEIIKNLAGKEYTPMIHFKGYSECFKTLEKYE